MTGDTLTRGDVVRWKDHGVAYFVTVAGPERSQLVMVGDDYTWYADNSEIELIPLEDFCGSCGQIGCGHG